MQAKTRLVTPHNNRVEAAVNDNLPAPMLSSLSVEMGPWRVTRRQIEGELDHGPTRRRLKANVRFGSKADVCTAPANVRFTLNSDIDCVFRHVRYRPKADVRRHTQGVAEHALCNQIFEGPDQGSPLLGTPPLSRAELMRVKSEALSTFSRPLNRHLPSSASTDDSKLVGG